jgi:transposase InsO family protein
MGFRQGNAEEVPTKDANGHESEWGEEDFHRRRIVGWAMSHAIDSARVLAALSKATTHRLFSVRFIEAGPPLFCGSGALA